MMKLSFSRIEQLILYYIWVDEALRKQIDTGDKDIIKTLASSRPGDE